MLELNSISKSYQGIEALKNISISLENGEIVAVLGPNASGKTTLYKILSGLIHPSEGNILYQNTILMIDELRSLVGYCPQHTIAWKNMTILEQLLYQSKIQKEKLNDSNQHINYLMETLNLKEFSNYFIQQLSGGIQKRFSIAMSLIRSPKLLILDEPTNGLDLHSKIAISSLLKSLVQKYQMTILVSSHDLREMEKICDRFLFIKKGILIQDIKKDELQNNSHQENKYSNINLSILENLYLDIYKEEF